jgi:hypothetical protein
MNDTTYLLDESVSKLRDPVLENRLEPKKCDTLDDKTSRRRYQNSLHPNGKPPSYVSLPKRDSLYPNVLTQNSAIIDGFMVPR